MTENKFSALSHERYSCRHYSTDIPARSIVDSILGLATLAPSACNRQPWRMMIVGPDDIAARAAVKASYSREWIGEAPYYVIVCGVPAEAWVRGFDGKNHVDIDVAILTEHICLAATGAGLGTCWVCNFDPAVLGKGIAFEDGVLPVVILPMGYPAETTMPEKKRKELNDIILRP